MSRNRRSIQKPRGILCGAERSQEWMLPWWWSRYSEHNHYPVTFCDFGMSEHMRSWCAERGEVVSIGFDSSCLISKSAIDEELSRKWEELHGWGVWHARLTWFKKPFAFLGSVYETGIWIDLDCEVLGSLEPLFIDFNEASQIALVREFYTDHLPKLSPCVQYNGGVVVFRHGAPILEHWAEGAVTKNHLFVGDDSVLSHLIHEQQLNIQELPEIYNWRMARGLNLDAVILHWVGKGGKAYIRKHGGLKPSLDTFYHF